MKWKQTLRLDVSERAAASELASVAPGLGPPNIIVPLSFHCEAGTIEVEGGIIASSS
jgi:hypothetical protein